MRGRALAPFLAAAIGLGGALAATLSLHHAASGALDRVLDERLRGAGEAAAALLASGRDIEGAGLGAVRRANELDGAYVVDAGMRIVADAAGTGGRRVDLLRLDVLHLRDALGGATSVAPGYTMGTLTVLTGYFPIKHADGTTDALILEAGQPFIAARAGIAHARAIAIALSGFSALGLALLALSTARTEREKRKIAVRAAQGEAISRVAAMAAHEIRNPLGVIRGTIELMQERSAAVLSERDRAALDDVNHEVERLRRLTQDLLDLSSDRQLALAPIALPELLDDVARATEAAFPGVSVVREIGPMPVIQADGARLRQVFANLLVNAAQAQREGPIFLRATTDGRVLRVAVQDRGPGIPADVDDRLFELYFTTKSDGTGLGLAVARRLVERHGGTLTHRRDGGPGATFEVTLPLQTPPALGER